MANIDLLVGRWRVGVRPDTDATRRRLGALLAPHTDTPEEPTRTNFSVRDPNRRLWRNNQASLHVAGDLAIGSTTLQVVAERLAGHLAGVAADVEPHPHGGRVVVEARVAVQGNRAVLVLANCVGLLDVPDVNVVEASIWHPVIDASTASIVLPPLLDDLDWRGARLDLPRPLPKRLELAGVVVPAGAEGAANLPSVWLAGRGDLDAWGLLLGNLDHGGAVEVGATSELVRDAIRRILARP